MEFDLAWLLLALPVAFALGWGASRLDLRQLRLEPREAPRAYFRGLSLLLNEQQDKAVDAFIEAVRGDPDAVELHFALGGLFRRRGEFERAIRVHEHLLNRADIGQHDRDRARHALAQDFLRAGLFDRAEAAFRSLEGSEFHTESRLALLALHERSREWTAAISVARSLESAGAGSFAQRVAHYCCELALDANARGDSASADEWLHQARVADPSAARPWVMAGQWQLRAGQPQAALEAWRQLVRVRPQAMALVADDFITAALACGQSRQAAEMLEELDRESPSSAIAFARARLISAAGSGTSGPGPDPATRAASFLAEHLRSRPSLAAVRLMLEIEPQHWDEAGLQAVQQAVARAAQPLSRHRCAACGFEAQRYFWQCPGCLGWDTFPARTVEEL